MSANTNTKARRRGWFWPRRYPSKAAGFIKIDVIYIIFRSIPFSLANCMYSLDHTNVMLYFITHWIRTRQYIVFQFFGTVGGKKEFFFSFPFLEMARKQIFSFSHAHGIVAFAGSLLLHVKGYWQCNCEQFGYIQNVCLSFHFAYITNIRYTILKRKSISVESYVNHLYFHVGILKDLNGYWTGPFC